MLFARGPWRAGRLPACDCRAAALSRANVLLIGDAPIVRQIVRTFWTYESGTPLPAWRPGSPLPQSGAAGVIVVYDVNALSADQQRALSAQLESGVRAPQIVSTSATPLFAQVQAGRFCETLYYRLNTICIDLQDDYLHACR
jgi:hypothetical protein